MTKFEKAMLKETRRYNKTMAEEARRYNKTMAEEARRHNEAMENIAEAKKVETKKQTKDEIALKDFVELENDVGREKERRTKEEDEAMYRMDAYGNGVGKKPSKKLMKVIDAMDAREDEIKMRPLMVLRKLERETIEKWLLQIYNEYTSRRSKKAKTKFMKKYNFESKWSLKQIVKSLEDYNCSRGGN